MAAESSPVTPGPFVERRGRPREQTAKRSVISLRVPDDVYDRLLRIARARGLSLSDFLLPRLICVSNKSESPASAAQ